MSEFILEVDDQQWYAGLVHDACIIGASHLSVVKLGWNLDKVYKLEEPVVVSLRALGVGVPFVFLIYCLINEIPVEFEEGFKLLVLFFQAHNKPFCIQSKTVCMRLCVTCVWMDRNFTTENVVKKIGIYIGKKNRLFVVISTDFQCFVQIRLWIIQRVLIEQGKNELERKGYFRKRFVLLRVLQVAVVVEPVGVERFDF